MGTKDIWPLLVEVSLPIMISMLIQALYNIVDSGFVSQVSEEAFTAVSMALPIQNLMIALAVGTGVGINALLSRSLGEKKFHQANESASTGIFLAIIHSLVFLIFGFFLPKIYYMSQTDNLEIVNNGVNYLSTCTIFSLGLFIQVTSEKILQSTGRTLLSMISQGIGAILNIILDPIFIFGYFGVNAYGIKGAAIATVIGQGVAAIIALFFNFKFNSEIEIDGIKPSFETVKKIYAVGIPSFGLMSVTSITIYGLNKILTVFSTTAVAALGAYFKMQSFIFMPVFGLNNGMVPIVAYNYGARNKERAKEVISLSLKVATIVMVLGFILMQVFPEKLLAIFNASEDLLEVGVPAIRIISFCFLLAGYNIVCSAVFQALGNGTLSLVSSLIRQVVVLLPMAYILSLSGKLELVWLSYPVAEGFNFIYCRYYLKKFAMNKIESIKSV